jgi:uncharacterized protein DUF3604
MTAKLMKQTFWIIFMSCMAGFALPALAAEQPITDVGTLDETSAKEAVPAKPPYSPYAGRNFPTRPFFGDTHVHTSFSMDAGAFGCRLFIGYEWTSNTGGNNLHRNVIFREKQPQNGLACQLKY